MSQGGWSAWHGVWLCVAKSRPFAAVGARYSACLSVCLPVCLSACDCLSVCLFECLFACWMSTRRPGSHPLKPRRQSIGVHGVWTPPESRGKGEREGVGGRAKGGKERGHSLIFTWIDATGQTCPVRLTNTAGWL